MNQLLTPSLTLQKLTPDHRLWIQQSVVAEAVVPVRNPQDLARRFKQDRCTFVALLNHREVVGFVHVALVSSFPTTLESILSGPIDTQTPKYGVFYGITRASDKIRGQARAILDQASARLLEEWPDLTLATFSPMPTFRSWLEQELQEVVDDVPALLDSLGRRASAGLLSVPASLVVENLARYYLRTQDDKHRLADPVARFHIGNGASLQRILVGANGSWRGQKQSLGVMASYQYHPEWSDEEPQLNQELEPLLKRLILLG